MILPPDSPLADVVVRIADQLQRQPLGEERAEALAAVAVADHMEGIIGQRIAGFGGDLAAEDRAEARSVLPTSSVTVAGFGSAESKLFLNFFIRTRMSGGLFKLEVIDSLRVEVNVGIFDERVLQQRREVHLTGAGSLRGRA